MLKIDFCQAHLERLTDIKVLQKRLPCVMQNTRGRPGTMGIKANQQGGPVA